MFKIKLAKAGQIQGGGAWTNHIEENLSTQIVPEMGKDKAKFLSFKPRVLVPVGVLWYCYLC